MDRQIAADKKKRGEKSLLEQAKEGAFEAHKKAQEEAKGKNRLGGDARWGLNEKDQERVGATGNFGNVARKRAFDPEDDHISAKFKFVPQNQTSKSQFEELLQASKDFGSRFQSSKSQSSFLWFEFDFYLSHLFFEDGEISNWKSITFFINV